MAVTSPDITSGVSSATRQRDVTNSRLTGQRQTDLDRIVSQFGSMENLIAGLEALQYGADQTVTRNAGQVATRDQASRTGALNRDNEERIRNQGAADRAAAQGRSDATERSNRETAALAAVDAAYGGYDNAFFDNYASGIINSRMPAIRDSYKEKNRSTTLALSQRGTGQSSAAARIIGRLRGAQAADEAQLAQDASDATETLRQQIDASRSAAIRTALEAAGIQQNTPVAGATVQDILAARRQAGAGTGAPGLSAAPPSLSTPPKTVTPAPTPTPTPSPTPAPTGGNQGGGGGGVLGDQDGDGKADTIFNSDARGGQISGVEYEGGPWVYAHFPGSEGYDDFASGNAGGGLDVQPVKIPQITYPAASGAGRRASTGDTPVDLAQVGLQMPLQPPAGGPGDTTPLAPTMRVTRPGAGTVLSAGNGTPEQLGGTQKLQTSVPQVNQTRTPDQQAALNAASLPVSLGGTLDNNLWMQRANNVDFLPEALGGTGRGPI